ncbi:hypothetical protein VH569_03205 [Azospirillum sp. 11R-A]|uniref:hypothetical protein n=1 Tax=Azospirillum sp. 11R-A TaxID=3111634 RepID=UPI003C14D99E
MLFQLAVERTSLRDDLSAPFGQFVQADDVGLVGIEQTPVGARQPGKACHGPLFGPLLMGGGMLGIAGELMELGHQPLWVFQQTADMLPHGPLDVRRSGSRGVRPAFPPAGSCRAWTSRKRYRSADTAEGSYACCCCGTTTWRCG